MQSICMCNRFCIRCLGKSGPNIGKTGSNLNLAADCGLTLIKAHFFIKLDAFLHQKH